MFCKFFISRLVSVSLAAWLEISNVVVRWLRSTYPWVALATVFVVNMAWIGFLGYVLFQVFSHDPCLMRLLPAAKLCRWNRAFCDSLAENCCGPRGNPNERGDSHRRPDPCCYPIQPSSTNWVLNSSRQDGQGEIKRIRITASCATRPTPKRRYSFARATFALISTRNSKNAGPAGRWRC